MNKILKPIHKHDCAACRYLGSEPLHDVDFYICVEGNSMLKDMGGELIARYSSDGPEYSSGNVFYGSHPFINMAGNLALARGLVTLKQLRCDNPVIVPLPDKCRYAQNLLS